MDKVVNIAPAYVQMCICMKSDANAPLEAEV